MFPHFPHPPATTSNQVGFRGITISSSTYNIPTKTIQNISERKSFQNNYDISQEPDLLKYMPPLALI